MMILKGGYVMKGVQWLILMFLCLFCMNSGISADAAEQTPLTLKAGASAVDITPQQLPV